MQGIGTSAEVIGCVLWRVAPGLEGRALFSRPGMERHLMCICVVSVLICVSGCVCNHVYMLANGKTKTHREGGSNKATQTDGASYRVTQGGWLLQTPTNLPHNVSCHAGFSLPHFIYSVLYSSLRQLYPAYDLV